MSEELKPPARPEPKAPEGQGWAPRLPWKWILLGIVGLAAVFSSYYIRRDQRQEALRESMLSLHERELTDLAGRYLTYRQRLERLVIHAAEGDPPEAWADERLNLAGLRNGEGLYLRIPTDFASSPERIEGAALAMRGDAITRCMGLAPMSVRGLYEKGYFLTQEWVDGVRNESDMMDLRVLDDQLGRHVQVDAPVVVSMMQADWFMLVIEQGESRRESPVDVYLWDLNRDQVLLRARIQGRGLLVPVRIRFEGVHNAPAPGRPSVRSGGAADCSIASQIRALTGHDPVEFHSGDRIIAAAEEAEAAAAAEEAESAGSASEDDAADEPPEE